MSSKIISLKSLLSFIWGPYPASRWIAYGHTAVGYCYSLRSSQSKGWYVLAIKYRGTEPRNYVRFRSYRGGFTQGINVRPSTRRIRVVRLPHACKPLLELESVDPTLHVIQLRLKRISSCQAWQLIFKKLYRRHPKYMLDKRAVSRSVAWRDYNQLQCGRFGSSALANYRDWMRIVEPKFTHLLSHRGGSIGRETHGVNFFHVKEDGKPFSPAPHGSWVIAVGPNQVLARQAEHVLAGVIERNASCGVIYTDYDRISVAGTRYSPNFKPALNIDLAFSDPMYAVGCLFRADVWNRAIINLSSYSSRLSLYGVFLEALSFVLANDIIHVPQVLFHLVDPLLPQAVDKTHHRASCDSVRTVEEYLRVHEPKAKVDVSLLRDGSWGQQVNWNLSRRPTLVSIVLPTRDAFQLLSACITSLFSVPAGIEYELIIIDNGSVDCDALALLEELQSRENILVIRECGPFNYSALINKGVLSASGDLICLLNNDTEIITENWLATLSAHAMRADIGCVGPMLLFHDNTVQHGGVVLGIGGIAGHAHKYLPSDAPGYQLRLQLCHNFSAVTGACLVVRSSLWRLLGGLDESELPVNYNDVDFCLRARSAGFRNLYVPHVKLYHHESKSRGAPVGPAYQQWQKERQTMLQRWHELLDNDPAYSPHLSLSHEDFSLSLRIDGLSERSINTPLESSAEQL